MARSKAEYIRRAVELGEQIPAEKVANWKDSDFVKLMEDLWKFRTEEQGYRTLSRDFFRKRTGIGDKAWIGFFGTFPEYQRAAGIKPTRNQRKQHTDLAKHKAADIYRELNSERAKWGAMFEKPTRGRIKTIVAASDFHDKECDPFAMRVLVDTIRRIREAGQLDMVILAGDVYDLPEFGRFYVDPRTWDAPGRIKFVHEHILGPIRDAAGPETQIDLIEGNHEFRLVKHFCNKDPETMTVLSEVHGWGIREMLGLDKFEINYIGKADLTAWNKGDEENEVTRNFKVYYDAFLVHHEPAGRHKGLPGLSGHHHYHQVWHESDVLRGSFEWHQLGAMHYRDAVYCDGEKWSNGFMIMHVDTQTKQVVFNYVDVRDFAEVAGQFYFRGKHEHNLGE